MIKKNKKIFINNRYNKNYTFHTIVITFLIAGFAICGLVVNEHLNTIRELETTVVEVSVIADKSNRQVDELNSIIYELEDTIVESKDKEHMSYLGSFELTFYCPCEKCCGKTNGITASGAKAKSGVTIAMDTSIVPFGEYVYIDGFGARIVQDKGGAIKNNKIDVFVDTHEEALQLGRKKNIDVWLIN